MERFPDMPEGKNAFDRFVQGLRRKAPRLNEICTDLLVRCQTEHGGNVVSPLLLEVMLPGKQPNHRVRILEVVRRIGAPLSVDNFFTVMFLIKHPNKLVAAKAAELIAELRPNKPETTTAVS
jgi:hypothetical protein